MISWFAFFFFLIKTSKFITSYTYLTVYLDCATKTKIKIKKENKKERKAPTLTLAQGVSQSPLPAMDKEGIIDKTGFFP